jgi:hypothetical protein
MRHPRLALIATCIALGAAGCAPTLRFNQSFLVAEDMKISDKGYASLQSTGESFDLSPIRAAEGRVDKVIILKVHGSFIVTGEGFKNVWRLWPAGTDEIHYAAIDDAKAAKGQAYSGVSLQPSGKCALFGFNKSGTPAQLYISAGGDIDSKRCPDA